MNLQPTRLVGGECVDPVADTIYQIKNGHLNLLHGQFYQYVMQPAEHFYLNLNVPVDSAELAEGFTVTPDLNYKTWYNGTGLRFYTEDPVVSETLYKVKVASALVDTFGNKLSQPLEYKFQTEPFELKVGNVFGIYFGPIFEEDLSVQLPG